MGDIDQLFNTTIMQTTSVILTFLESSHNLKNKKKQVQLT